MFKWRMETGIVNGNWAIIKNGHSEDDTFHFSKMELFTNSLREVIFIMTMLH